MAVELLRHSDARLDAERLTRFINAYQAVAPLTIGELWAWPSMLKLALIENLRRLAEEILRRARARARPTPARPASTPAAGSATPRCRRPAPPPFVVQLLQRLREYGPRAARCARLEAALAAQGTTVEDVIRGEHQRQAADQVSMANAITSLRLCATLDWRATSSA